MSVFGEKFDSGPLESRVAALEADAKGYGKAIRNLELEWIETYDKVARQMSRMAKRYAVDVHEKEREVSPDEAIETGPGVDTISAGILRRRAGNGAQQ